MDITDNHFHLDPGGQKEKAVKAFLNSGGTRLVLVHKPYSSSWSSGNKVASLTHDPFASKTDYEFEIDEAKDLSHASYN